MLERINHHFKQTLKTNLARLGLFCFIFLLLSFFLPVHSFSGQPSPNFGVGFSLPNYPNCSEDDYFEALWDIYNLGGHSGFIWHWDNQHTIDSRVVDIQNIKAIGLPAFVQISLGVLGELHPPVGYAKSFADPDTRALYLDNVRRFSEAEPEYMNLATEANFIHEWNFEEWGNFQSLYQEAYDLVKSISPGTQVGVSFHYGLFIWKEQFPLPYILGSHDYVAFTSYPDWLVVEGFYASIEDIPADWYEIARRAFPDTPILFSEIGWSSRQNSSHEEQDRFIQNLPRLMSKAKPELITWVFIHDTSYFNPLWAEHFSAEDKALLDELAVDIPLLFNQFNGMGLKELDGTPKPAWNSALSLDFSIP